MDSKKLIEWLVLLVMFLGQTFLMYGRFVTLETKYEEHARLQQIVVADLISTGRELSKEVETKLSGLDTIIWRLQECEKRSGSRTHD